VSRQPAPAKPETLADVGKAMAALGRQARAAAQELALAPTKAKNAALMAAAGEMRAQVAAILDANARDLAAVREHRATAAFLDRLTLDPKRVEAMAKGLEEVAALADPIGSVIARWSRPNGLTIERVRAPLGVIGIIYESRPNVTADAGALCLKSGNAAILRGGSESHNSSRAIQVCLARGLRAAGLPDAAIQLVPTTDREAVGLMLKGLDGAIDVIVPAGGKSLVARCRRRRACRCSRIWRHLPHLRRPQRRARHGQGDCRQRQDAAHRRVRFHETLLVDAKAPAAICRR
jgi:glutamate-5-semialdehyde dehydrogenase